MGPPTALQPPIPAKAPPYNVLFVCLGNICRSPMAHGYFERHLTTLPAAARALFGKVDSAGTLAYHAGDLSDSRTLEVLAKNGISDFRHRSRKVRSDDFEAFDLVLGMDTDNYDDLLELKRRVAGSKGGRKELAYVGMFGDFDAWSAKGKQKAAGAGEVVDDPYYGGKQGFSIAYEQMERFSRGLVAWAEAAASTSRNQDNDDGRL